MLILALALLQLTGPENQVIDINPNKVVSMRAPRGKEHFGPGVHCLVHTSDGKYVAVVETCEVVKQLLEQ